jgi:PIN domain nuclease of toxin-antitoxin system
VRLLLDTHALLWAIADPDELAERARDAIRDGRNAVLVSAASVWEIAIKRAMGKLTVPEGLRAAVAAAAFEPLTISFEHAELAGSLPTHHHDPFDRMLIAQAQLESLTIVTRDARFARYEVHLLGA